MVVKCVAVGRNVSANETLFVVAVICVFTVLSVTVHRIHCSPFTVFTVPGDTSPYHLRVLFINHGVGMFLVGVAYVCVLLVRHSVCWKLLVCTLL